jgi:GntR family transcriptional repressor for pyruvate dehydrogenase complex
VSTPAAGSRRRAIGSADPALYEPLRHRKTTDTIVEQLEGLILERRLEPGDFLPPERELAAALSVSRNVLREALGILGQKGLVRVAAGRGTTVVRPSTEHVEDALTTLIEHHQIGLVELCDARLLIEPELAANAAGGATQEGIRRLEDLMRILETTRGDSAAHVAADRDFHAEIARLAGNRVLAAMVQSVRAPVTRSMLLGTSVPRAIDKSDQDHRDVLEAIRERDQEAARSAMVRHIRYVRDYVGARERLGVPARSRVLSS